jgi:hypothetical protein
VPKPTKAIILKIDSPISAEYAKTCSDSCDKIGLKWEYHEGYMNLPGRRAWEKIGIRLNWERGAFPDEPINAAECCSASHVAIWKKIAEGPDDAVIILEHDAIMLQTVDIDIPHDMIVTLGYKGTNPEKYDHVSAGPPKEIIVVDGHEGAHAYAITKVTAKILIDEIEERGKLKGAIDNAYFLPRQRCTRTPLGIASPTPAFGWLRKSTIWNEAANRNVAFIPSFLRYYK